MSTSDVTELLGLLSVWLSGQINSSNISLFGGDRNPTGPN